MNGFNPLFQKFLRNQKKASVLEKTQERQLQNSKLKTNLKILKEF